MTGLHFLAPVAQLVHAPYTYLGLALLVAGFATIVGTAVAFHRAGTTIKPFEQSSVLITGGLYRITRNPIYVSMVVALVGLAVFLGSASPVLVVPAFAYLVDRRFIRPEETMLEQTFGAEYAAYKKRVRRWV
jgi:protein-S-isoprenylcysteine O-methyltransferase Ste14